MSGNKSIFSQLIRQGLTLLSRTRLPKIEGEISLAGLHAPAEVLRDRWGIPHIYAQGMHDLFFVQGFVHAQDRLWQMEFNRRMVAGRIAEVLGEVALPLDRWMRTLTMRRVAEFEVAMLDQEASQLIQAYANGVNAYIAQGRLPVEFILLRHRPEPWVVADTLAWIKMMSWSLSVNWESEALRAQLVAHLGPELAAELEPPHLPRWPYIIHPGSNYSHIDSEALRKAYAARPFTGPSPYEGLGSNNWVLAGSMTTSGKPILANDMHLGMTAPAIWYENHLIAGDINLTGITFPGIPGIISGFNGRVAWGFTNGLPDVQDLYMEHLRQTPDGRIQAEYNGEWEDAKTLHEAIRVKRGHTVREDVVVTRHGPIINSLSPELTSDQPLALRWTSLEPDTMIHSLFAVLRSRDCQEFHQALRHWTGPTQNVVYADVDGNIAYTFAGKIPMRARGRGRLPVPGWVDDYEWTGYIPFEALPHLYNPPQGYIITANNRTVSEDYPIHIELEPCSGDRAQRIAELIMDGPLRDGQEKIDLAYVRKMQIDQISPSARVVMRFLTQLPLNQSVHYPETDLHAAVKLMREWDGRLSSDSPAAALYQVFIRKIVRLMLIPKLEPDQPSAHSRNAPDSSSTFDLTNRYMGKGPTPVIGEYSLFGERWLPWLVNQLADPDSHWFNLGHGETRDEVMALALNEALAELKSRLGPDMSKWKWGTLHQLTFNHSLGANPLLAVLFNRGPYPIGGDHTTVWASGASYYNLDTSQMIGPPFRMAIDLGDLSNASGCLAPGQSGNPASPHYGDQIAAWFKGKFHPMLYARSDVEEETRHRLKLAPR